MRANVRPVMHWTIWLILAGSIISCPGIEDANYRVPNCTRLEPISGRPRIVEVTPKKGLVVDSNPFFVCGAGYWDKMEIVANHGANAIRTWGEYELPEVLDLAAKHNLMVLVGLWVRHEYGHDDQHYVEGDAFIAEQRRHFAEVVKRYKDHPSVLAWSLGHEVDKDSPTSNLWKEMNHLSRMIKEIDPNHPTTTVITREYMASAIPKINEYVSNIDFLSVAPYGNMDGLLNDIRQYGWRNKPYLIADWGSESDLQWSEQIGLNTAIPSSSYRRERIRDNYDLISEFHSHQDHGHKLMGSFVYIWGNRNWNTPAWFSLLDPLGRTTELTDELHYLWKHNYPTDLAPTILAEPQINGYGADNKSDLHFLPNTPVIATVLATDPNGDPLTYRWQIHVDHLIPSMEGDVHSRFMLVQKAEGNSNRFEFTTPLKRGPYRLYVYVDDRKDPNTERSGQSAFASIPFTVTDSSPPAPLDATSRYNLGGCFEGETRHGAALDTYDRTDQVNQVSQLIGENSWSRNVFGEKDQFDNSYEGYEARELIIEYHTKKTNLSAYFEYNAPIDISTWRHLVVALQILGGRCDTVQFKVAWMDGNQSYTSEVNAQDYGFGQDSKWYNLVVPLLDFDGADLKSITRAFVLAAAGCTPNPDATDLPRFRVDNLHLADPVFVE